MSRIITITFDDLNGWDVHENGKCCGGLGWDEMLGQVAMLTMHPERVGKGFGMRTPQEWADHWSDIHKNHSQQAIPPLLIETSIPI